VAVLQSGAVVERSETGPQRIFFDCDRGQGVVEGI